jgi:deoxyribodipyrimidine photo-lyase
MTMTALLWFRRDLRLADHHALTRALAQFERVVGVFVLDDALLRGRFASAPRTAFMLGCLRELDADLRDRGSGLVVRHGRPEEELVALAAEAGASAVLWTSDVAPYARARDRRVTQALPSALRKGRLPGPDALGLAGNGALAAPACEPGEAAARAALARWLDGPVDRYGERHDALGEDGPSRRSPYLRWGCVSAAECEACASGRGGAGAEAWVRQLAWREFYADWRHGERHFEALLLDGEPTQNNGNWQWVTSVGQAAAGCVIGRDDPAPIVEHASERRRAIERYRAVGA